MDRDVLVCLSKVKAISGVFIKNVKKIKLDEVDNFNYREWTLIGSDVSSSLILFQNLIWWLIGWKICKRDTWNGVGEGFKCCC